MPSIFNSFQHLFSQSKDSVDYYNTMNTDIVGLNGSNTIDWMSTGLWSTANNYNAACQDLAGLFAEEAEIQPQDKVLDLGCGCGEQDFYWKKIYPDIELTALDVTPLHIDIANKRAKSKKIDITFFVGDACKLDFDNETFSKVMALDCAFHFNERKDFLQEAYRVLKVGGTLAVSDMLPAQNEKFNSKGQKKRRKSLYIPQANMYDKNQYIKLLETIGFTEIQVQNLEKHVFGGMSRYYVQRYLHPKTPINELVYNFNRKLWGMLGKYFFHFLYGTSEYVIICAKKEIPGKVHIK